MAKAELPVMFATNGAKPASFVVRPSWEWIICDEPGCEGFAIEARANITIGERDALIDAYNERVVGFGDEYRAVPAPERVTKYGADSPAMREYELIAPFIRDWNAVGLDLAGNEAPLPPPAIAGPDIFLAIYPEMGQWAARTIIGGYIGGKGVRRATSSTAALTPMSAPPTESADQN